MEQDRAMERVTERFGISLFVCDYERRRDFSQSTRKKEGGQEKVQEYAEILKRHNVVLFLHTDLHCALHCHVVVDVQGEPCCQEEEGFTNKKPWGEYE